MSAHLDVRLAEAMRQLNMLQMLKFVLGEQDALDQRERARGVALRRGDDVRGAFIVAVAALRRRRAEPVQGTCRSSPSCPGC